MSGSVAPVDWREVNLEELVSLQRGHDLTWRQRESGSVPVMGSAGANGFHSRARAPGPGVVLGRSGASFGQAHFIDRDYWPHNTALYATDFHGNDPRFVYYLLSSIDFTRHNSGGAQQSLNRNFIASIELTIPKPDEQKLIAMVLDEVSDQILAIESLITKKHAIKKGMMQQLLTGKTRLPGFTGDWGESYFESLAVPARERTDPRSADHRTRLIELEHVESGAGRVIGSSTAADAVSLKSVFRPGDVLFGKLRSYLRKFWLADSSGLCSTEIWVLRAQEPNLGAFVRYLVESEPFIEIASGGYGTHMPRADWSVVRKMPVLIPSADEQRAIAEVLQDADHEIVMLRDRLDKVRSIKQGMMQELLSGRTRLPVTEAAS